MHDVIHVVFGCPTDLSGEIMAHLWTVLGTDVKLSELRRVTMHRDHRQALREIGHGRVLAMWIQNAGRFASTWIAARRMTGRLKVENIPALMDRSLCDIRRDLGIRVRHHNGSGETGGALVRRVSISAVRQTLR